MRKNKKQNLGDIQQMSANEVEVGEVQEVVEVQQTAPIVELKDTVTIDGREFRIKPLNASKAAGISNIIGKLLLTGKVKLKEFKGLEAKELPTALLFALDEATLVKFAALLIGADEEFVKESFDLSWVVEALAIQVRVSDMESIARNFTLLVSQLQ